MKTRSLLGIGLLASVISLVGLFADPKTFFITYLETYLVVFGLCSGSMGIWVLHNLTGGEWGVPIGRAVQATARTLPLVAILFIPILLGLNSIFPWANRMKMIADSGLPEKFSYLNPPFFVARTIGYFAIWFIILGGLVRRSARFNPSLVTQEFQRLENWSGVSAVVLLFSISFALIDWVLSIEPVYYSTVGGALIAMMQLLGAFSFCIFVGLRTETNVSQKALNDLGNLLLTSTMLWMYLEFSQYLITWSGQIKAEIVFYNARVMGGWQWVGGILLLCNFLVPFLLLLFKQVKGHPKNLSALSCCFLVMQVLGAIWYVGPSASPMKFNLSWLNLTLPIAMFSIWSSMIFGKVSQLPPLARITKPEVFRDREFVVPR